MQNKYNDNEARQGTGRVMSISELLSMPQVKKKRIFTEKQALKDRLMTVLGRNFWQVNGVCKDWTEAMLRDALTFCEHYSNIKLRNMKFNEYAQDTKINNAIQHSTETQTT